MPQTDYIQDEDLLKIAADKASALTYRERKHDDWTTNYTLKRDKVITNRLTQRQTINIPLMRYGLQTIMKDIDEPPMLYFQNLDNDQQKEIFYNEYWNKMAIVNKLDIKDRMDKDQATTFGRTFKKLNIKDGMFSFDVVDPQDMLVERHVDPSDLDSARCIIQTKIFRTLTEIVNNKEYNPSALADLKSYYAKDSTTEESEKNVKDLLEKQKRMSDMGLTDAFDPLVGETYVELNEVYRKEYNKTLDENEIILYVVASTDGGMFKLFKKPLQEVIGETSDDFWCSHFPYTSWGPAEDRGDFWSDGPADTLRQSNIVLNSWVSGLVENRTLKNFNMHYFDSSNAEFVPQTFTPVTWGWYPVPGEPDKVIKDVTVPDLSDSLEELQFIIGIAEKAVAATSVQTGQVEPRQITLGEVQIAVENAKERNKSMSVFYENDWKDFGLKYAKMLEAKSESIDSVTVHKRGRLTSKVYTREISPQDWYSKSGYKVEVKMKQDKDTEDSNQLEKLNAAKMAMPDNLPLDEIYKKKLIDFAGLDSDDQKLVMDFEKQKQMNPMNLMNPMNPTASQGMVQPGVQPVVQNPNMGIK